jgi:poly(3-hydroxybutyrate) depolymerase
VIVVAAFLAAILAADPLGPGDHTRSLTVDGLQRSYLVHIPPNYDPKKPAPVILLFHGAASNGPMHVRFARPSSLPGSQVVAQQTVAVPQVQHAAGDDWVRPARAVVGG